ncbi:hypothetical protein [Proteus vulgaris]|uniref:hypothetical protein n=1 Tax=Proteus vulgaris TaxID=585 RepID=UPI0013D48721|nr:hypothetical protein [Proteus vulgaris]
MTDELGKTRDSFIVKAWNLVISFIVGLSAFFILRLIILITLNLIATSNNVATMQTIGGIMVVLSIGIAAIYTKILNSSGTLESRKRKKIITVIVGGISLYISTVLLHIPVF